LAGPALAKRASYHDDSHFSEDLSALRKAGRIVTHTPGYSLPE
jgi:hypothetical protein